MGLSSIGTAYRTHVRVNLANGVDCKSLSLEEPHPSVIPEQCGIEIGNALRCSRHTDIAFILASVDEKAYHPKSGNLNLWERGQELVAANSDGYGGVKSAETKSDVGKWRDRGA